ncbi:hypothetical protein DPMN_010153 [Dreissena polymorpha]|uniref:CCHC-type domain-containing protein n=1 Tax=Dreissena polymorpha TaxID=45954 RepID=A0A9D4N3N8_DREPO|nr:hypothetical protein DPMN_010153 [Dreissena polymorpha]
MPVLNDHEQFNMLLIWYEYQYVTQVVDGKMVRKNDHKIAVNAVQSPGDVRIDKLEKAIEQLTCKFEASLESNISRNNKAVKFPQKTFRCFHCIGGGHMKRDCKKCQEFLKSKSESKQAEKS